MSTVPKHENLIGEFHDRVAVTKSEGTAKDYRSCARNWVRYLYDKDIGLFDATTADLRVHLRELVQDDYSASTVHNQKIGVSVLYQELADMRAEGYDLPPIPDNPAEDLDISGWSHMKSGTKKAKALREDIHAITPEEVDELCKNVQEKPLRNELIIRLGYQTMCRPGELAKIRLSDIDKEERSINIRAEKVHLNREVYYQPNLDFLLDQWMCVERKAEYNASQSPYLFPTAKSEHISPYTLNRLLKECAERAGVQGELYTDKSGRPRSKTTFYTLRHTGAVQSVRNGMSVRILQKILGHADISTTMLYLRMAETDARDSARKFGPGTE